MTYLQYLLERYPEFKHPTKDDQAFGCPNDYFSGSRKLKEKAKCAYYPHCDRCWGRELRGHLDNEKMKRWREINGIGVEKKRKTT